MTANAIHQASVYASDAEFLAMAMPFVTGGLDAGEPVLVTTTSANLELLGDALGDRGGLVDYAETGYFGRRPHQRVAAFHDYWQRNADAPRVRILAEPVWAGRSRRDTTAWLRMESGLNVLLADTSIWMICPYDARTVDPAVLAAAKQNHPSLVTGDRADTSTDYLDPYAFLQEYQPSPLRPPPAHAVAASVDSLEALRGFVAAQVERHGLSERQEALAVTAVNEAATYLRRRQPVGEITVRIWPEFEALVCDLHSTADGTPDPFAGYRPPSLRPDPDDGLWLVRQLCTHVDSHVTDTGHTLRLHLPTSRDGELTLR